MHKRPLLVIAILLAVFLAGCRNETQNRIRRSIQDVTVTRMWITLYTITGTVVFEGLVDGKVTTALANEFEDGGYIFWFDERGRYHQTDLPYLATTYDHHALRRGGN
jgi:hypothetical protein